MPRHPTGVVDGNRRALGYVQQVIGATAEAIDDVPSGASAALIIAEGDVRWRDDGDDPTASVGMPLLTNGFMWYYGSDMAVLKFIRVGGTDVTLNVSFYD